ncbi:PHP domain-containing protein [Cellulomonas endometrii]|uniref:PHP domain-containing protein n=1 Tax=Cellulomonas endometrii TaxID=3036301 RepID=UPI0024AD6615|nr:PHP domain-containing protein [Cellulomonas endometrii]
MAGTTGADAARVQADVVAALRRAAFLLERGGATSYRADAFRAAVRTLERTGAAEVEARLAAGTLTDLPGVGARTAEVATAAAQGGPVPYLADLEQRYPAAEATGPGAELRAALRGDLHAHSEASDGSTPIQEMVLAAMDLGHEYLAITDHSPRLTVANGLSPARLRAQLDQVEALNRAIAPFRVLTGIEVDVLDDGALDQEPELLDRLDVVVASVHSKLRMDAAAMTRRMRAAVANPLVDVLGHCTGRQLTGRRQRPPSEFDAEAVFADCAEHGVAVEVNCRPDRLDPPHALLDVAVAAGCLFTVDTDAHAPGQLSWQAVGCDRAAAHGIGPDRVLDAWPLDRLREHLDGRRTGR